MSVTNTKCPITMLKTSKSENFKEFGPLKKHGPHWINFTILTFMNENNRYSKSLYKIWNKIISFDMREKKIYIYAMAKVKKKVNLNVLELSL
jgi:hypothetical protein